MSITSAARQDADSSAGTSTERARSKRLRWSALNIGSVVAGTAFGFALSNSEAKAVAIQAAGEDLTRLLHFMAIAKTAIALATAALVTWRLAQPTRTGLACAYVVATTAIFVAPGLIWQMQYVAAGALLFHAGLFAVLLVTSVDSAGRDALKDFFPKFARVRQGDR